MREKVYERERERVKNVVPKQVEFLNSLNPRQFDRTISPGVNFINVLRARFSYKSYVLATFLVTFWLWRQNFVQKNAQKC
jgi:hypothetical protein